MKARMWWQVVTAAVQALRRPNARRLAELDAERNRAVQRLAEEVTRREES